MTTHTGENSYKCSVCEIVFLHTSALKIHMKIHIERKPYQCNSCDKDFLNTYDLKIHMKQHSDEKPYQNRAKVYLGSQCDKKLTSTENYYQNYFNNLFIKLKLPLQCGRTVTSNGNCFYDSVIAVKQ